MESKNEERKYDDFYEDHLGIGKQRRYYTAQEVAQHNHASDCWVSIFGKVFDLSSLVGPIRKGDEDFPLTLPILKYAGQDISDWFDPETRGVKMARNPETGLVMPFLPEGRFLHVAPSEPVSNWSTDFDEPWFRNEKEFCIGMLSDSVRKIRLVNMLTYQETILLVCEEESLNEIQDRYVDCNAHSSSYTWKILDEDVFRPLDMERTLTENGILDETALFKKLSIDPDEHIPTIHVYFNDDLTEA